MCDAERFITGLKMLAEECNMSFVRYNGLGIWKFEFEDGSTVGGMRAFMDAGIVNEQKFMETYAK